jgi:prevent-host-death family protein
MTDKPPISVPDLETDAAGAVTVHYAKTHLSRLLREVAAGAEYVISRGDTPVARLVPIAASSSAREFGALRDSLHVPSAFIEPLEASELDAWDAR